MLQDASQFAANIDSMMKHTLGIASAEVEEEEEVAMDAAPDADKDNEVDGGDDDEEEIVKDEL